MKQRDGMVEQRLSGGAAGDSKIDGPELLTGMGAVLVLPRTHRGGDDERKHQAGRDGE
jgi:hypothetical protein